MGAPNLNVPVQGNANILISQLDLRYREGFDKAQSWAKEIAEERSYTKGKTVILPWNDPAKRLSRFKAEFKTNPWIVNALQTTSEPWQSNIAVDRYETIENIYMDVGLQAKSLGNQCALLADDTIALALRTAGSSSATPFLWYDGEPVFSEQHPIDPHGVIPGTWKNLYKGVGLNTSDIIDVIQQAAVGVKLPNGRQVSVRFNKCGVSGKYIAIAKEIFSNDLVIRAIAAAVAPNGAYGASNNVLKGMIEPVIMDQLAQEIEGIPGEEDVFYLWDDRFLKPVTTYYIRRPYTTPIFNDADGMVRKENSYFYLAEGHAVSVVTAPWFIARCEPGTP